MGGLILYLCTRFIDGRAQEHRHSCSGTKSFKNALPGESGDGIKDAKGKYLSWDIQESVAHKANLRKPLFWGEMFGSYYNLCNNSSALSGGNCKAGKPHKKGIVSPR